MEFSKELLERSRRAQQQQQRSANPTKKQQVNTEHVMASRARRSGSQMNGGGGQPAFSTRDPALARKCVSQASDHQTRAGKLPLEEHTRATFGAHLMEINNHNCCEFVYGRPVSCHVNVLVSCERIGSIQSWTPLCAELKKQASQEQHCVSMQTSPTADLKAVTANILVDRAVQLSPNPVFEPAQRDRMQMHSITSLI